MCFIQVNKSLGLIREEAHKKIKNLVVGLVGPLRAYLPPLDLSGSYFLP